MLHALIMAGGAGTRFWPASRVNRPKQLLDLAGPETMIQATVARLGNLVEPSHVLILTNQRLVAAMREQLPGLPADSVVGEPCKRDTAPCVGLAAALMLHADPDATMVVMPADHVIQSAETFRQAIARAAAMVDAHPRRLVTFGIKPTYPAESFGYIERAEPLDDDPGQTKPASSFRVRQFREKPRREVAEEYLSAETFFWNSGIFVWKARTVFDALLNFEPEMGRHLKTLAQAVGQPHYDATLAAEFAAIQGKSIDYAVMERYEDVAVIEAPFQWDDVGSWGALARLYGQDELGNTILGRHVGRRTENCVVRTNDQHLVVTLGVRDLVIVHTPDATLVAHKNDEESIRQIVQMLEERGWDEYL